MDLKAVRSGHMKVVKPEYIVRAQKYGIQNVLKQV